ncbi:TetR/AcrR family transcriptional regulator [Kitasatospora sp. NBC_01250]|uniref:TetR/AcrR family transcriptional regulator n=1 Tax=unclassified Kitasatospora TaxID=2633591 RepID=UPI002E1588C4|nr:MULTISPECIES: helix-turn-helix domain-containing protein [unclassified Kitasatospora]WSJ67967.1 TetR/AcrR family transcriptional regulator [Kitasatospora sp. NBC_01302]
MGNREELLAGAKRCLAEKGYGRTTARDIATASGVSLAAIGYHFGSKDALLNIALIEAMGDWGETLGAALAGTAGLELTPEERFVASWDQVLGTFAESRGLWKAQFEVLAQVDHVPEIAKAMADAQGDARLGLSALFQGKAEVPDTEEEHSRGAFLQMILAGVAAQWLIAPDRVPTGRDLYRGLQLLAGGMLTPPAPAA